MSAGEIESTHDIGVVYKCWYCGTVVAPYNTQSLHGWCPTCGKAVKLLVETNQSPSEEAPVEEKQEEPEKNDDNDDESRSYTNFNEKEDSNDDEYVIKFFDFLADLNSVVAVLSSIVLFVVMIANIAVTNSYVPLIGIPLIGLVWIGYAISKFFILTAKGMYRNLSIVRKNVEKLTENVEIVR